VTLCFLRRSSSGISIQEFNMRPETTKAGFSWTRRQVLMAGAALAAAPATAAAQQRRPTNFQMAGMTLTYSNFPFERALEGIAKAGYRFVAWGTRHREASDERREVIDIEAPPSRAKELGERCRNHGLTPVMMFSGYYVGAEKAVAVHTRRIEQAAAAGIPFLLTFGEIKAGGYPQWIRDLKELGPIARQNGVMVVIKQHGGNTATGRDCAKIIADVGDEGIRMCYDAGNVLDYENDDPIPDIEACWRDVRAFCIKDHRNWPEDQDCGPGFGEIDHYRLLAPVAYTGLDMPLAFENIFEPLVERPATAEGVDDLARRAREYVESVVRGLHAKPPAA
jgi:sugar phosphate isomerase/epimerase